MDRMFYVAKKALNNKNYDTELLLKLNEHSSIGKVN